MSEVFTRWQDPTIEKLQKENQELKRQLEYLRSGEYLNQLKYERNLLESIVQDYEIPKEDKEFIDMTHRNTELLEQINKATECIKDFLCTEEYISLDGEAIANNYHELLKILQRVARRNYLNLCCYR